MRSQGNLLFQCLLNLLQSNHGPGLELKSARHSCALPAITIPCRVIGTFYFAKTGTLYSAATQLESAEIKFFSGAILRFSIKLEQTRTGPVVAQFKFHLLLPASRTVKMVRIHLNNPNGHDPLRVLRCRLHIDQRQPHVPFPVTPSLLLLDLVCRSIEPDLGAGNLTP